MEYNSESESTVTAEIHGHLTNSLTFEQRWSLDSPSDDELKTALSRASKQKPDNPGKPDLLYINRQQQLLILCEIKPDIKYHRSPDGDKIERYAEDGLLHYLSFFRADELEATETGLSASFKGWKIFGVAFAGDFASRHYVITTHLLRPSDGSVVDVNHAGFLNEQEYISVFKNLETGNIIENIDASSKKLNEWLRPLDSQKRPILLSALMICLISGRKSNADFCNNYRQYTSGGVMVTNILHTVADVLAEEDIPTDKISVLTNELQFLNTDISMQRVELLRSILLELETNVIPLFDRPSSYDVLGKFYHDFLTYAGVTNVKNGIVLTPKHVCELFIDLVEVRIDDVFMDPACGTGAFLIAAMDRLNQVIGDSQMADKMDRLKKVKERQLIGFEINSTMYALSVSNMLFRGDGKSRIYNADFFSAEAEKVLEDIEPTIGFINPPYGGKDSEQFPTKKEVQFLERMLDKCNRYGVIIAPWSTFITELPTRTRILTRHNLIYSINMPVDLFQPNASTCTTICVFKTNVPHNAGDETVFFDLKDDGFVLTKKKGRIDLFNRWAKDIGPSLRDSLKSGTPSEYGECVGAQVGAAGEWLVQDYTSVDYEVLEAEHFVKTVKEYAVFLARYSSGRLASSLDDVQWIDLVSDYIDPTPLVEASVPDLNSDRWQDFPLCDPNDADSLFTVSGVEYKYTKRDIETLGPGEILYVTTSNKNNGVTDMCDAEDYDKGVMTVDSATDGKTYYQAFGFVGSDHVETLRPMEGTRLNVLTGLFLVTLCDLQQSRYGYGRKRAQKRLKQETLKLPVTKDGAVDYDWIESYMETLPYSNCLTA